MYSQCYVHPQHLGTHPVGRGAGAVLDFGTSNVLYLQVLN